MRFLQFMLAALLLFAGNTPAEEGNPVQFQLPFDDLSFASEDWIQQTGLKTIEERKWELVPGKFGQALYVGAVPLKYDIDNMSGLDLDMVTAVIFNVAYSRMKGVGYDEPFLWGAGKLHPASGSIAFWAKGAWMPENPNMLFEQTTTSWGRKEKELLQVRLLEDGSLIAYVEDARYVQHAIQTPKGIWKADGWNHVVFNWERSSGLELWVNGTKAASSAGTDSWWENQRPGLFHLPLCKGSYDEFYIFNRPVSEREIADLFRDNRPPSGEDPADAFDAAAVKRLKTAYAPDAGALPALVPSAGKTLVFREITPQRIHDEGIQGWWIADGRYELAWPHEYSVFTIIPGDVDFHAEKADVLPPRGAEVNYVTFEGNLDGVVLLKGDRSGKFSPAPALSVPKTKGFFYGAMVKGLGDSELRIPFTRSFGTPPGFQSDGDVLRLPLSGDLRLQEFGMFHVSEQTLVEKPGDMRLFLGAAPVLDDKRYPVALSALYAGYNREIIGLSANPKTAGALSALDLKPMTPVNLFSEPAVDKTAYKSIILDLWVKSPADGNLLSVRLFDPAVPSHTWTHAEAKLNGFAARPGHLRLALEFDPLFLAPGDRVWLQVFAADGLSISANDPERPATVILRPEIGWLAAEPKYSLKTMRPNILTYGRSFEYIPWQFDKRLPDVNTPTSFGGQFDMAYPWQAVLKINPADRLGNIYQAFGTRAYTSNGQQADLSGVPHRSFIAPVNAPDWAVYFRDLQTYRNRIITWWRQHQRSDGQAGGGWNDDTLIFSRGYSDLPLDSNPDALALYNNAFDGFDRTNYFQGGYCRIYPIDRLHNGDFVRERYKWLVYNLGDPRSAVWAMEEAWHWGKPDKTPQNYGDGKGFLFGKDVLEWYWGKRRSEKPYTAGKPETLVEQLRRGADAHNEITLWRYTEAWIHSDDQNPLGSGVMHNLLNGGWSSDPRKDSNVNITVGVGWISGGGPDLARFVDYSGVDGLKVRMYSFDMADCDVAARLYRLDPGEYTVTLKSDRDGDGSFETTVAEKRQRLRRFDRLSLTVPPRVPVLLELKQVRADPLPGDLPDLAVSGYFMEKKGSSLTVTVHNIGNVPSGAFTAVVTGPNGVVLGKQHSPGLEGAGDFVPKKVTLIFPNLPAHDRYTVVLDTDRKVEEIFEENNTATWKKN
ncbi:MAG: LamG-like jellyroll fold domain-containing protein [Candidatus Latescibacterota bacterium]